MCAAAAGAAPIRTHSGWLVGNPASLLHVMHLVPSPIAPQVMASVELTEVPVPPKDDRFPSMNKALNCWCAQLTHFT
jgi:hypothetical protein